MAYNQPKGFLGWGVAKVMTVGGVNPIDNTEYKFPIPIVNPRNPFNITYVPVVNASAGPSVKVTGKRTPSCSLRGIPLKASFAGAPGTTLGHVLLNGLIGGSATYLDANNNTAEFVLGLNNGNTTRYYESAKCTSLSLYQTAMPGPALMDLDFISIRGDSEGTSETVTTPTVDAGNLYDTTSVDFGSSPTAAPVYSWRFTVLRPQAYQMACDGTLYSDTIQTGGIGGMFSFVTTPIGSVVPSTSVTIRLGASAAGIVITGNLSLDETAQDIAPSLGTQMHSYTLFNAAGGYPFTFATYP